MHRAIVILVLALPALFAADPNYERAERKLERLEKQEFRPGEAIELTPQEVDAWVRVTVPEEIPDGIRNPRLELGMDSAAGSALVDFLKIKEARGSSTNRLLASMIEGERPLKVSVRISCGAGQCTVFLTRVELAGAVAEGALLDFLIKTFFTPLYPDAKINQPFEIGYNIDRIDFRPEGIKITIKK
jgi:hypothetical protein